MDYDVFNGDADGICSLIQMRLAEPRAAELVTGVKRDVELLERVAAGPDDRLLVLDLSMDANKSALARVLDAGAHVRYFDHHHPGEIPEHPRLEHHVDTDAETCTGLLVDAALGGRFRKWAVTAAFGDNLAAAARRAAAPLELDAASLDALQRLGICVNYNGYGASVDDLHFHPAELYRAMREYEDPLDFVHDGRGWFPVLEGGYRDDMARAEAAEALLLRAHAAAFLLPDAPWSRRVSGVWSNDLANARPERAHAVVTAMAGATYRISVRAPLERRAGADALCRRFPTGGGRQAAAGINALPADQLDAFLEAFAAQYES